MQVDLKKSMPTDVNEISLNALIAATGVSRTKLGIEQSGVTRDTAEVQDDQFIADISMPALQIIINALNQDYKRNYNKQWKKDRYRIYVDSPLGQDRDAELKDIDVRSEGFDLYTTLVNRGYDRDIAARYVAGEMTLEELGDPKNDPVVPTVPATPISDASTPKVDDPNATPSNTRTRNALDRESFITDHEAVLKASVVSVQAQLVAAVVDKVTKNDYKSQSDIVDEQSKHDAIQALIASITLYYLSAIPPVAADVLQQRVVEFADLVLTATPSFVIDGPLKNYIAETAQKAAGSHVNTILDDLLDAVRKAALEGASRDELISAIRQEFSYISTQRADLIAKSETYRSFNRAQYDADRQFLESVGKLKQAYKQWTTHSDNPCPFCLALAAEAPVPFDQPFRDLGDDVQANFTHADGTSVVRVMHIDYEKLESGNAHPRCECDYELIIKDA
ncbi:hypothetical protein DVS77_21585 [Mycolicibacterium moriokaense]|nr:hypothetical protein DVS77_21585 [Mycolicibacterium moriokaense]